MFKIRTTAVNPDGANKYIGYDRKFKCYSKERGSSILFPYSGGDPLVFNSQEEAEAVMRYLGGHDLGWFEVVEIAA